MENEEVKKQGASAPVLWLAAVLGLALLAGGFFGWQYYQARNDKQALQRTNTQLKADVSSLKAQLSDAKKAAQPSTATPAPPPTQKITIPQTTIDNIQAALNTMNTAALEGYMAPSVNVVFAASEKQGPRTPTQAVTDLDYLKNATAPWDFALPASVLSSYGKGSYGQYFGANTLVGKSANSYVVSFGFNSSTKITTIFVAAAENLLQ